MTNFNSPVLTNAGHRLLNSATSGRGTAGIHFTKMAIGSGRLPSDINPTEQLDLINRVRDIPIIRIEEESIGLSSVTGGIDNVGVVIPIEIAEIGVYARDPTTQEDILYTYVYVSGTPSILYPPTNTIYKGEFSVVTFIGQVKNITADITLPQKAYNIAFNNQGLGIKATNVQDAIAELKLAHDASSQIHVSPTEPSNWKNGDWWYKAVRVREVSGTIPETIHEIITTIPYDPSKQYHIEIDGQLETVTNVDDGSLIVVEV